MANLVLIIGESGTGKSTSIKTLKPEETFIIQVINKILPFKNSMKNYPLRTKENPKGNRFISDNHEEINKILEILGNDTRIKNIVIDDSQYIMANEFLSRAQEKSYEKFTEIGKHFADIIRKAMNLRHDLNIYFLHHEETKEDGTKKAKTIGKMLDDKVCVEGLFTIVLNTEIENGNYYFRTQNNGRNTSKSPEGMFEDVLIPNDLNLVSEKINEFLRGDK